MRLNVYYFESKSCKLTMMIVDRLSRLTLAPFPLKTTWFNLTRSLSETSSSMVGFIKRVQRTSRARGKVIPKVGETGVLCTGHEPVCSVRGRDMFSKYNKDRYWHTPKSSLKSRSREARGPPLG